MPRLVQITLTLVLFTAVMLAVGWVLKQVVPAGLTAIATHTGWAAIATFIVTFGIIGLVVSLWPRDANGRLKRLPTRR